MTITTFLSSQEFSQDALKALDATVKGPVFIADCGATTHVLLSFQSYQELLAQRSNIAVSLGAPDVADIEFDAPRLDIQLRKADFR
ncbi:type II toxin-antitoxin system Phd/YefM family antitoxin [Herbaspirillum huttiense]|uniref:type II toxin-antitoxin system Phd/YefM family antitoxin n=1 Tax=Herbaspirillum huttiense TaxID=863372 RepID=UPI0021769C8D|nr:type II toxin-antitoxin system Phd/YefM family antitoxin [Herbaspirillum huttiense]UWE15658.1 type II toxin-antitoxin system Phd/YefM family antitoxin [Herbaspirillum huttiense]